MVIRCDGCVRLYTQPLAGNRGGDCDFLAYWTIHEEFLQPLNVDLGPGRTRSVGAMAAGPLNRCRIGDVGSAIDK